MKYIILIMVIFSFNANAEFVVKFGGWSKHSNKEYVIGKNHNESHNGYGFDYLYGDGDLKLITGAWYMKDSYNRDSYQVGVGGSYNYNKYLSVNLTLTYFNRSFVEEMEYKDKIYSRVVRGNLIYPLPYVTINITDKLNMDVMAIVDFFGGGGGVGFVRLGYKF